MNFVDDTDPVAVQLRLQAADLAADVAGLRADLRLYQRAHEVAVAALEDEIETRAILSRYARRTWFEVMAWLVLGSVALNDLARAHADSGWWGLAFWTTQHGAGGPWEMAARIVGFGWQAILLGWLALRSQVPPELEPHVPAGLHKRPRRG